MIKSKIPIVRAKRKLIYWEWVKGKSIFVVQFNCSYAKYLQWKSTRHFAQPNVKQFVVQNFSEMTVDSYISDDLRVLITEPSLLSVTREVQPVKG